MKKKINWGILSTAKIAETALIPAIRKSKNSNLYSIASRNEDKSKKFASKHSILISYGSYKKLYTDPDVDIIYNPLPNHLHLSSTIEAAKNGKHVLLEKPITLKSHEVDKLISVAKKNKIIIKEAYMVRYHPQWIWIKKKINENFIGDIQSIQSLFCYENKDKKNIRNIKKYGGGGLYDIGCYPILISRYLLNKEPSSVIAIEKIDKKFKTDILTSAILDFNGVHSSFTVSTRATLTQKVTIVGSKKTIVIENPFNPKPDKKSTIVIYNGKSIYRNENIIKSIPASDQYENEVTYFSNCILKHMEIDYGLEDAKNNMKVIDSLFNSIKKNKWIKVK